MKVTMGLQGFDELQEKLEAAGKGENTVSFEELCTDSFMRKHSKFSSFKELIKSGGFGTGTDELKEIPNDEFIKENTDFDSWDTMKQAAYKEWVARELSF